MTWRRWVAAVVVVLGGCGGSGPVTAPPASYGAPPPLYVAVGASESLGAGADRPLVEGWPQLLYRGALPTETIFIDLAVAGSTVPRAVDEQLPLALELEPTLVTVWLNVNDLLAGVPAEQFRSDLLRLVSALRATGARVLVANTPPVEDLPAYQAGAGSDYPPLPDVVAAVGAYNAAVADVVALSGAELVDLHAAALAARAEGVGPTLVSPDGLHPSTAGHARIAEVFAAVVG